MELVARRAKAGKTEEVVEPEEEMPRGADIIDLTELLKRSLGDRHKPRKAGAKTTARKSPARKKPRRIKRAA
jgi:DNA end-binding protein Ku